MHRSLSAISSTQKTRCWQSQPHCTFDKHALRFREKKPRNGFGPHLLTRKSIVIWERTVRASHLFDNTSKLLIVLRCPCSKRNNSKSIIFGHISTFAADRTMFVSEEGFQRVHEWSVAHEQSCTKRSRKMRTQEKSRELYRKKNDSACQISGTISLVKWSISHHC